ncbi:hypothetical protein M441DRAFT_28480 [Trichoderma asperellum CBS 433.97]|uniref:BZIP domain-containing protein n=1 Tax=Trichoderma asperellum (strain ATCC 204424 / CBS 433.97 / NBRC 101777) TaxID=1042311 RepID=A0A2T3Z3F1_TRIA4|nr:hypothetical protein M441DRAFT_28480 [Trichoderma asperellum CBS 433.97]PTB39329.1 hypothetical protein M441DRAFT_28480 [Trichoderma asperellum CBS 433.97]
MANEEWLAVADRSQKKRIQNRVAQRTYRNRIKERMEELQKEVNEYRRREQQQASTEPQDGSVGESEGDTINVNSNGEKTPFPTEQAIGLEADIKSLPSVGSNTPPPSTINPANLSSNNSIHSRSSPEDVDKEKSGGRNSNGYTMDIDTHEDAPSLIGSINSEPSTRNIALQQAHAVVQPQRLTQPQHQRTHISQQFPLTAFGLAAPALPPAYNLPTDWPWTNTPNLYRDPMGHQAIPGFPNLRQVRSDHDSSSDASYTIPDVTAFMVHPHDSKTPHVHIMDQETDVRTIAGRSPDESSDPGSLSSESSIIGSTLYDSQDKNLAKMLQSYGNGEQRLKDRSLEERLEFMRVCASVAGFHSIDDMAKQYYTADLSHDSVISQEQRNSRHSQLPRVLSKLRKSVKTWTQWEAHRYQYEIIKSAQSLIRSERTANPTTQHIYTEALMDLEKALAAGLAHNSGENELIPRAFRKLSKVFQDTVSRSISVTMKGLSSSVTEVVQFD